jgi:glucokinase
MKTEAPDDRIVMTLDAGRTGLKFSAIRGSDVLAGPVTRPTEPDDLEKCLHNITDGFENLRKMLPAAPAAISFAFPGPADYPRGIINNLKNFKAFEGEVPLGPILEDRFHIPVFINNDGDLFAYGEAIAGFLPYVNGLLAEAGSPKRYHNLFGITIGTGFGGGVVHHGELLLGDNSAAGEAWLLRNKLDPSTNAEEGVSIRAVRRVYAERAGIDPERAPEPKEIFEIGMGQAEGNRDAAIEAYRQLGEVSGDALAQALTLVDGLVVVGGGLSSAWPLFLPALIAAVNGTYSANGLRLLVPLVFDLQNPADLELFLRGDARQVQVGTSSRMMAFDSMRRTGVGLSRLSTTLAVAVGARAFALQQLDKMKEK